MNTGLDEREQAVKGAMPAPPQPLPAASPSPCPTSTPLDARTRSARSISAGAPLGEARVIAVIPCYNRQVDLENVLGDLARLEQTVTDDAASTTSLRIIVVDNCSQPALSLPSPSPGRALNISLVRLETNTGGSGGYNAGMAAALDVFAGDPGPEPIRAGWPDPPAPTGVTLESPSDGDATSLDLIWLIDSDARIGPRTLTPLIESLRCDPHAFIAGSAIAPAIGEPIFELGGRINPRSGAFEPVARGVSGLDLPIRCQYVAACCALVRADTVRSCGGFPDVFINGDDVLWCLRLSQRTGTHALAVPRSVAAHPTFDRVQTWTRYYTARNAFGPIDALGLTRSRRMMEGGVVRLRRATIETARAVA
ncbi:MAG: glycosyltransferase family 2 protein, partial [Phycisphaerales bacterium]|nr:glycosyltransferase family 2 protein [Phycisphaerales bacterium]